MSERDEHISPGGTGAPRHASVKLRSDELSREGGLDPANQSLADALKLVFRGLQIAMVVLVGVFVFSGLQTVNESERGIKLLFGRKVEENLPPGPQFAAPYPFGELIKVVFAGEQMELSDSFWPKLSEDQKKMSVEKAAAFNKPTLRPGEDGSNITADQNIAHTRWLVQYRRKDTGSYAQNVYPDHESRMVQAAVERGVVQALAGTKIDDLLKQSSTDQGSVARRAQAVAQETLKEIGSGIVIEQLTLKDKAPPFSVFNAFSGVQSAEQKASEKRIAAESQARNMLNATAGAASEPLVAQIDAYERAIARKDTADQQKIMDTIDALLDGRSVTIGGKEIRDAVSGRVSAMLNDARQYRSTIVSQRRAELATFQAKLVQFKTNPDLVVQRDWADAMSQLMSRDIVEAFWVPAGMDRVELWLNRDIYKQKQIETARKREELKAKEERNRIEQEKESLKTRTDVVEMSTDLGKR
jgi:membrane protease subunit HflK